MSKFKVGDRAILKSAESGIAAGSKGTVVEPQSTNCMFDEFKPDILTGQEEYAGTKGGFLIDPENLDPLEETVAPTLPLKHGDKIRIKKTLVRIHGGSSRAVGVHVVSIVFDDGDFELEEMCETYKASCRISEYIEMVVEEPCSPSHTHFEPQVGQQFRVINSNIKHWSGAVFQLEGGYSVEEIRKEGIQMKKEGDERTWHRDAFTSEFLQPILGAPFTVSEETATTLKGPSDYVIRKQTKFLEREIRMNPLMYGMCAADFTGVKGDGAPINKPKSLINTMTNYIKNALMSKEDKALIKAGFLADDLSLTSEGRKALEFISFEANKKALVAMAEEAIAQAKEDNA